MDHLEISILGLGIEAGAGLADAGEVTVTDDLGIGIVRL
jgi:hypothetical protein